jgi:hypothetical protein
MPYLNGYSMQDAAHQPNLRLDLGSPLVRRQIVAECLRYVSMNSNGSYVRGAKRAFDGVVLDIEPAGDASFFISLKLMLSELRDCFDKQGLNKKKVGIAAPQHTARAPKTRLGMGFVRLAEYVNYLVAMTYDSGVTDPLQYQAWMADQTVHILQAVYGSA